MNRLQLAAGAIGLAAAALSFTAWQKEAPASSASTHRTGAELFMRKGCGSCHTGPQTTARLEVGPSLADASEWADDRQPGIAARDYLNESIRNPPAFRSPEARDSADMPSLNLTDAEIDALVAYLLEPLAPITTGNP